MGPISVVERERALSRLGNFLQTVPLRQDPFATIDACVQQEMEQLDMPGAAIAIALDGELVYERGYGVKHREEGGTVDSNPLFQIGSTTKMMTAAAVMQQVDRGTVDLGAAVTTYVPEFDVSGPWPASRMMMVWNLLTHSRPGSHVHRRPGGAGRGKVDAQPGVRRNTSDGTTGDRHLDGADVCRFSV